DELARLRGAKVGFIFQSFHLIPSLTAYENILVPMEIAGLPKARERAQALLEEVGLRERGHHYPSQLSGGEQQRVAIARAFSNAPTILLADEPTGNLDSKNGAHIFELLVKLNREHATTLLLVTHDHTLANQADRVISLNEGRIVEDREKGSGEWEVGNGEARVVEVASSSPTPHSPLPTPLPSEEAPGNSSSAWPGARCARRGIGCCSSFYASPSALVPSSACDRSSRTSRRGSDVNRARCGEGTCESDSTSRGGRRRGRRSNATPTRRW